MPGRKQSPLIPRQAERAFSFRPSLDLEQAALVDRTLLVDGYTIYRSNRPAITVTKLMAATRNAAAAPGQRSYAEPGRLTLEVQDDFCPWNSGRFALEGGPGVAACRPTGASPDLTIAVSGLASAYLGAVGFTPLAGAGLADEHTPGALHRADRMFAVQHQPWTPFNF